MDIRLSEIVKKNLNDVDFKLVFETLSSNTYIINNDYIKKGYFYIHEISTNAGKKSWNHLGLHSENEMFEFLTKKLNEITKIKLKNIRLL